MTAATALVVMACSFGPAARPAGAGASSGTPYQCGDWYSEGSAPVTIYSSVALSGLHDAAAMAAGTLFALAIRPDGTVWGWGYNDMADLGVSPAATFFTNRAVQIPDLTDIVAISAQYYVAMALRADGTVWTWGADDQNRRDANGNTIWQPLQVAGLGGVVAISAGGTNFMALKGDGTVWTWGWDGQGQLGNGVAASQSYPTPMPVPGLSGVVAVSAGTQHSMALRNDGAVWVWGNNTHGQLGLGTFDYSQPTPAQVPGLSGVKAISAAYYHSLAILGDGSLRDWGSNYYGELGDGTTKDRASPQPVAGLGPVSAAQGGLFHTLVLLADGTLRTWGYNSMGQLCQGPGTSNGPYAHPLPIPGSAGVTQIAAGEFMSLALVPDSSITTWPTATPSPILPPGATRRPAPQVAPRSLEGRHAAPQVSPR